MWCPVHKFTHILGLPELCVSARVLNSNFQLGAWVINVLSGAEEASLNSAFQVESFFPGDMARITLRVAMTQNPDTPSVLHLTQRSDLLCFLFSRVFLVFR